MNYSEEFVHERSMLGKIIRRNLVGRQKNYLFNPSVDYAVNKVS